MAFRRGVFDEDDPMAEPDFAAELDGGDVAMGGAHVDPFTRNRNDTPFQQMLRHWQNERHSPDILPGQEPVLNTLLDHIRRQSNTIQLLRSDPDCSEDEHFRIMLAQTEIERVKFIVRSYIRTRFYKIEKYAQYIVVNEDMHERLSQTELDHAKRCAKAMENHLQTSVLRSLPEDQRALDDEAAFVPSMVTAPDKTKAVFVLALEDCPPVRLPDGNSLTMLKGHIVLTPYAVIEQLLALGSVELI